MNKNYFYFALLVQLFIFNCATGQSVPEQYMQQAGQNATLYRGPLPQIIPYRYNGSIYAFQEAFTHCDLWYNHKFYPNVLLNLDAYRDELYARIPNKMITLVLEKKAVEKFRMEGKDFINILPDTPYKNLAPGFYQVVYNGKDKLLKKIRQLYSERPGEIDKRGVFRYLDLNINYFVLKDNIAYPVKQPKSCRTIYKEQKSNIQKFIKENNLKYLPESQMDLAFQQTMQFIESNRSSNL